LSQKLAAEQTSRQDAGTWTLAALDILAKDGIDGVRIELLARRLGVTKGSFYWHFRDRGTLHEAMLDHWRRNATAVVSEWLSAEDDPRERYARFMGTDGEACPQHDLDVELAIRMWALRDPRAGAALREVDELRIRYIASLLQECGVPADRAHARAVLAYAYRRADTKGLDATIKAQCEADLLRP
jgi:AcrR family transcriptional regulator